MAGDWIKVRVDLHEDPAVIDLAAMLGLSRWDVVGRLVHFWSWASQQSYAGTFQSCNDSVTLERHIDVTLGANGFVSALVKVGWLEAIEHGWRIPKWDRHLSQSAKQRALTRARVARHREKTCNAPVTKMLRLEKRREESRSPRAPLTRKRAKKAPAAKRDPALELFERLSLPRSQRAEALEAIAQHGYTAEDLAAWDDCYRQARKQSLRDPPSFVRARMLRHRHPRTTGISWYVESVPEDEERKRLVAAVRKHAGKTIVDTQRREWRLDEGGLGFHGPRGFRLVSTLPLDDLRAIAGGRPKGGDA